MNVQSWWEWRILLWIIHNIRSRIQVNSTIPITPMISKIPLKSLHMSVERFAANAECYILLQSVDSDIYCDATSSVITATLTAMLSPMAITVFINKLLHSLLKFILIEVLKLKIIFQIVNLTENRWNENKKQFVPNCSILLHITSSLSPFPHHFFSIFSKFFFSVHQEKLWVAVNIRWHV